MSLIYLLLLVAACDADFYRYSYNLCKADAYCIDAFFLDRTEFIDYKHFRLALEIFMYEHKITQAAACESESLWLKTMSLNRPCLNVNEFYDSKRRQCICKPEKVCEEMNPWDIGVSSATSIAFAVIVIGGIFWYGSSSLQIQRENTPAKRRTQTG